jgi:protein arginine kinase
MKTAPAINAVAGWLAGQGREGDIVLSSRVRLARNIAGFNFLSRTTPAQQAEIVQLSRDAIMGSRLADDMAYFPLGEMDEVERQVLMERRLISKELARGEGERGVAVGRGEKLSIMVNEEDHLRLQALRVGLDLASAWEDLSAVDDALASRMPYAFSSELGYLTACPTNVGTGLRASVMLHLPALAMTRHLEKVFNAVARLNMAVRGLYGEGTQATGDLFQVSNQRTLGRSEKEIIESLGAVVPQVTEYERQLRGVLLKESRGELEDQVWRAYGLLTNARAISSEEALYLLSRVRLGVETRLIDKVATEDLNKLLLLTQPAHVQKLAGKKLKAADRNQRRAELIRSVLSGRGSGE